MKKLITILLVILLSGALFAQQESNKKAYLGVMATKVDDALVSHLSLDQNKSFILQRVVKGTPASEAGLEKHDILLKVNNEEVDSTKPLSATIKNFKPDDKLNLTLMRAGKVMDLEVTLGETVPQMALADMKDQIKLILPEKGEQGDIKIQILENMEQFKELQEKMKDSFIGQNGQINEQLQKALEQFAKANKNAQNFKFNSSMSTVMSSTDGDHNVTITIKDGNKKATVSDSSGNIIFEGDINTEVEIEAIPEEVREKVKNIQKKVQIMPRKFH